MTKEVLYDKKKVGVARLKPTRDNNSKGNRMGPSLFHKLELHSKYIKLIGVLISYCLDNYINL